MRQNLFSSLESNLMIIFDSALWISFMKIRNKRDPSTEPQETPSWFKL